MLNIWASQQWAAAPIPDPPASASHIWLFDEGSGIAVADQVGGAPIDLSIASNATWIDDGIRTTDGRIQTPALTGVRTVAVAYRVDFTNTYTGAGYLIAMGAGNVGITQYSGSTFADVYETQGESYHQVMRRVPPENGTQAYSLGSGAWLIVYLDYGSAQASALWLGGRGGAFVTSRVPVMDIGACVTLTSSISTLIGNGQMQELEDYLCAIMKRRGIYMRNSDCPVQDAGVMLIGESDMSGRGVLNDLTVGERTQTFPNTTIMSSIGLSTSALTPGTLVIGTNQMVTDGLFTAATNFGFELGIAAGYEATPNSGANLAISKTAKGSTFNAVINANGANDPGAAATWDTSTLPFTVVMSAFAVREWFRLTATRRLLGIGTPLLAVFNTLTKNDGKNTTYTGDAAAYQVLRERLKAFVLTWTGTPEAQIDWVDLGCPTSFTDSNATAVTAIRTAQAAWAVSDTDVDIVDTDAWPFQVDGIHWTSRTVYDEGLLLPALAPKLIAGP